MVIKLEGLSENEQLAKIQETYRRLIALDFDNKEKEDINVLDNNTITGIKETIKDYKKNNFSKENSEKLEKILKDVDDFENDAKINNISTDFHQNFEANIPKEGAFGFALAYEELNPAINGFKEYNINSYIHYVSVVNSEWTDKNLVILEGEVYEVESKNNKWVISEKPLDNFEVNEFKIIENRVGISDKQKKEDAKKFDKEKNEKYGIGSETYGIDKKENTTKKFNKNEIKSILKKINELKDFSRYPIGLTEEDKKDTKVNPEYTERVDLEMELIYNSDMGDLLDCILEEGYRDIYQIKSMIKGQLEYKSFSLANLNKMSNLGYGEVNELIKNNVSATAQLSNEIFRKIKDEKIKIVQQINIQYLEDPDSINNFEILENLGLVTLIDNEN